MRLAAIALTAALLTGAAPAFAADDFGDRFGSNAPTALTEDPGVENIEPAAGDDAVTEGPAVDTKAPAAVQGIKAKRVESSLSAPAPQPTTEPAVEPEGGAKTDAELEEKMGTEVQSTTQELGDQTQQHDSVGEGKVRAFYKTEQDSKVMDNNDAAGVEVKVLEFK